MFKCASADLISLPMMDIWGSFFFPSLVIRSMGLTWGRSCRILLGEFDFLVCFSGELKGMSGGVCGKDVGLRLSSPVCCDIWYFLRRCWFGTYMGPFILSLVWEILSCSVL